MARQGIESNPKFLRLAQALHPFSQGMGEALARGLLEQLWDAAYTAADDNVGEAEDIEARVRWRGPAGAFSAMLSAHVCGKVGFIEQDEERGGFKLHDFWEHAPPWVKRKAENDAKRKASGKTISDLRREAGKRGLEARTPANGRQNADQLQTVCCDSDSKRSGREGKGREGKVIHTEAASPSSRARKASEQDHGQEAVDVLQSLSAARLRCRSSLKPLRPVHSNLKHIIDRLEEGFTVEDCQQVISVCEEECQRDPVGLSYLDACTPFRPDNFARKLGRVGAPVVCATKLDLPRENVRRVAGPEETARMLEEQRRRALEPEEGIG